MAANEDLHDAAIDHAVDLQHYSNSVVARIIAILNRADTQIASDLAAALEKLPPESFTVARLEVLLTSARQLNRDAFAAVDRELTDELRDLVDYEAKFQGDLWQQVVPPQIRSAVGIARVNPEQVYAAAMARPFQGVLLRGVLSDLEATRARRVRETIAAGYVANDTTAKIVQRVRGTRALGYSDGIFNRSRQEVEAVVRTAVSHTAAFTRDRFFEANEPLVAAVQWLSTLDARTSPMCRVRDGLRYEKKSHRPIGHTIPWGAGPGALHWCCRSTATPVLKSWKQLTGVDGLEFNPATRASMDGQVPASTTFAQWLAKQPPTRQDEILGRTRAEMFRRGTPLDGFYNDKGRYLTLEELRRKGAAVPAPAVPRGQFDTSTEAGRWHAKAFDLSPAWLRDVVLREQAVKVSYSNGTANATRGQAIDMGEAQVRRGGQTVPALEAKDRQSTWRHEFGHILDARLAQGLYRSSEQEFPAAAQQDAQLLQHAAARGRASKALAEEQQRRDAEYAEARQLIVDAADRAARDKVLQALANRAGVEYKRFQSLVAESTEIDPDSGIGAQTRLGAMLVAVQRGDAEEFIRHAMFMTAADKQPGSDWKVRERSWRKDGSFAALSDLVGSATRNKVASYAEGFWGHSDAYYGRAPWMAPTESFANLTALAGHGNGYWWELVKRFVPNMAREYEQIIRKVGSSNG